jgi:predicted permease
VAGRLIAPVDGEVAGRDAVAVISTRLWKQAFGGGVSAVGSSLTVDGRTFNVIGVAPAAFFGVEVGKVVDVWTPVSMAPLDQLRNEHAFWLLPMGRLHPDVTIEQAAAPMQAIVDQVMLEDVRQHAPPNTPRAVIDKFLGDTKIKGVAAGGGIAPLRQQYGQALRVVMALVIVLVLIACTNVANIRVARETGRQQEIILRLSLGAGPGRLVRQLFVETTLLACISVVLGGLVSRLTVPLFVAMLEPSKSPAELSIPLDFRLLLFAALLALTTVLATGLVPALHLLRFDPFGSLRSRTSLAVGRTGRIRKVLVAAQIALSLVLVVGAALFSQTLTNLLSIPLGFSTADILTARLTLPRTGDEQTSSPGSWTQLLQRARTLPGGVSVALSSVTLFDGEPPYIGLRTDARQETPRAPTAALVFVSAEFFQTLGIEVTHGTAFDERSFRPNAPAVVVVNESFAKKFFGSQDPLSHKVSRIADSANWHEIVGVVRDMRVANVRGTSPPIVFVPYTAMAAWVAPQGHPGFAMTLYVEGRQKASMLLLELQHLIGSQYKVEGVSEQQRFINDTLIRERLLQRIAALFGTLSLVLAGLGLYAVMNYSILQRRQEIGVRIALGADPGRIVRSLMKDAGALVFLGTAAGILIAAIAIPPTRQRFSPPHSSW